MVRFLLSQEAGLMLLMIRSCGTKKSMHSMENLQTDIGFAMHCYSAA